MWRYYCYNCSNATVTWPIETLVNALWEASAARGLALPSGRLVRGRGLRRPLPAGPTPTFALYLLGAEPPPVEWEARWLRWRDCGLPADPAATRQALEEAWTRAETERVEVACAGGQG